MKLSISARLGLGFGLVLTAMATGALVMTFSLANVKDRAEAMRSQALPLTVGIVSAVLVSCGIRRQRGAEAESDNLSTSASRLAALIDGLRRGS